MSSTCATSLKQTQQLFRNPLPHPRPWAKPISPVFDDTSAAQPQLDWTQFDAGEKTLPRALGIFEDTIRDHYRRKVLTCAADDSRLSSLPPNEYLMALLRPITDVINQLHSPKVLKTPMQCVSVELSDCKFNYRPEFYHSHSVTVYGMTFAAEEDFKRWKATAPVILTMPDDLFNSRGEPSPTVLSALSQTIKHIPSVPSIIVSNFKDITIFFPPTSHRPTAKFERVSSTQPALALRVISAAYLLKTLPDGLYLMRSSPDMEVDEDLILPEGPPQDPSRSLVPDEDVFATHHRNSDFDIATLVRDRVRALQFFRWHAHVKGRYSKLVAHQDDNLTAVTNEIGLVFLADVRPFSSFDVSEIPDDTAMHVKAVQRDSPLVAAGIADAFQRSKSFTLKIQEVITEGSQFGICTVYRCQITSIDNEPVMSPSLCLKLFDDRFQPLEAPDEGEAQLDDRVPRWFDRVVTAELCALNEAAAYDKLRPVQGSIIPWFYGTHQFTLPDGTVLYGLLMEYIEGWKLDPESVSKLSPDRQIDMIRSCRHAVRILDIADISQRDWHEGQIILNTNPDTHVDHAVFIDFASTTQTWVPEDVNFIDNYFGALHVLLTGTDNLGLDPELVSKHFGEPDDWDTVSAVIPVGSGPGRMMMDVQHKDLFPFISPA